MNSCFMTLHGIYIMMDNAGKMAIPILWQFFNRWGSAEVTRTADWRQIAELMHPLGLFEKRAKMLIRFSGRIFIHVFGTALIMENL